MGFYEELSKYYDIVFPLGKLQLKFITEHSIGKENILDLAAGTGNYSIALSKLGYNVAAVDLDEEMIKKIEYKNKSEKANVKSYVLNMKDIDTLGKEKFDTIVCIGNSLVHLDNPEEIKDVIGKMLTLLKDNGVVIIQIVNYDRILKYNVTELPLIDRPESGVKFIRNYELENDNVLFKTKLVIDNKGIYENCIKLYPLQSKELIDIMNKVGFRDIKTYGGFDEKEYTIDSFPLVIEAYK